MKIKIWGLAALSLALMATSCMKENVESAADRDGKITFKTALGKQSRATEFVYWDNTTNNQLKVVGYATGATGTPAAAFDQTLTFNGADATATSSWTCATDVYQPGYSITYYSIYYPGIIAAGTPALTANGVGASFEYTVATTSATQKDLIAATATTTSADVSLAFKHVFSQVNFAIEGVQNVQVQITNLQVNNVVHEGKYNLLAGTWGALGTPTGTKGTYTYAYNANLTNAATPVLIPMGSGAAADGNALMLMPQDFTAVGATGSFSFDYKLFALGANVATATPLAAGTSTSANFKDFTINEWEMGKRYVYLIDFSDFFKNGKINFTITVNPWVDAEQPDADNKVNQTLKVADLKATSIEAAITSLNTAKAANANLTIFPISLPNQAVAVPDGNVGDAYKTITLKDFEFDAFAEGDQIRINIQSAGDAVIALDASVATYWKTVTKSGTVYILERNDEPQP